MTTLAELGALARKVSPLVTVTIGAKPVGRVTGWEVRCSSSEHGTMPVLAPGLKAARLAARTHVEVEHRGRGIVKEGARVILAPKGWRDDAA